MSLKKEQIIILRII